ncbi:ABC transporter ATP-binding protein/permease VMR1 [Thalictrum thalictroides]|uniref:ABC transporter ATP-binding protein/permease VMR1 n=1 Tax=Thalictrum thalictroides TaxID=46969 RepID=A0A7J6X9R6_THATH|nr:ABC transporter ATP-binding protein/permease VMR1 [Thalictrum thalictroides]
MASIISSNIIQKIGLFFFFVFSFACVKYVSCQPDQVFNVKTLGAKADGKTDDAKVILRAWTQACGATVKSAVLIPAGQYLAAGPVIMKGPCKNRVTFQLDGTVKAPADLSNLDDWIAFNYVNGLTVLGKGAIDGQGDLAWSQNQCFKKSEGGKCQFPTNLRFNFVTDAMVSDISSIASKKVHINIFGCKNIKINNIKISAPATAPNTDGIHIADSTGIEISRTNIATGDDCVSIITGSTNVRITGVSCGPGHGISIGSMGKSKKEETVTGVLVKTCTFTGTDNGVRIKTWRGGSAGTASNLTFDDLIMNNVKNPIVIDQEYCPYDDCNKQAPSRIKISKVAFRNIRGTSATKEAVTLKCGMPCEESSGPGHRISIGRMGKSTKEETVTGVLVKSCTFTGTDNGVRIKTWSAGSGGTASNLTFDDLFMDNKISFFFLLLACIKIVSSQPGVFNVMNFGAKADGRTDDAKAILSAWTKACRSVGKNAVVLIPQGTYLAGPVLMNGPCKNSITFQLDGTVKAPFDMFGKTDWIVFKYINGLTVSGNGAFDGQGALTWSQNQCSKKEKGGKCTFPISLRFNFVTDATITDISSIDSKIAHMNIFACNNIKLQNIKISAPAHSLNTDGIHISTSNGVQIYDSGIATGDDCVSIITGSNNVEIAGVTCGPGHGISIGSMGKSKKIETVTGITVKNCTFTDTDNGVRIKTWPAGSAGSASNLTFEDIIMNNVRNPIVIDQEYCPYKLCNKQAPSRIKISKVAFKNIRGTSATKEVVSLKCGMPCEGVELSDINLNALDAHTGMHVYKECLLGFLDSKTVIYTTNQVEYLPSADLILVVKDGSIIQSGIYSEILASGTDFEELVGAHNKAMLGHMNSGTEREGLASETVTNLNNEHGITGENESQIQHNSTNTGKETLLETQAQIVQEEEREEGRVGIGVYWDYITTAYSGALVPFILIAQILYQSLQIASNYWIAWATPVSKYAKSPVEASTLIIVYIALVFGSCICVFTRATIVVTAGYKTATVLFTRMHLGIFRAPMSFFDATPSGHILNRASTDQNDLDWNIPTYMWGFAVAIITVLGAIFVMARAAWQVCAIFVPVIVACFWYQKYYIAAARELVRLAGVCNAPLKQHFTESISGLTTIRSFAQENRFMVTNMKLIDSCSRPEFYSIGGMSWLGFRLDMLSSITFGLTLVFIISMPEGLVNPVIAGLAVTYGLNLNMLQAFLIWLLGILESKIISVERILQYTRIPNEPPLVIEAHRPNPSWPSHGEVAILNLQVRYAPHLPLILQGVTCTFPGGKKTGVVGRTGSGKSTLIQTLFRIVEPAFGEILIDGINISMIGLHDLRCKLSIIPQDPTMFEGTVRTNLDPLAEYTDEQIWEALDKCQLGDEVRKKEGKLDSPVAENGGNWSMGQRQLLCLGRVVLKRSKILVLDEATSSVDTATDNLMQKTLKQHFSESTVIIIAHRIKSVLDSNLVLVLDNGQLVEYDSPDKLLKNKSSSFAKLVNEQVKSSRM